MMLAIFFTVGGKCLAEQEKMIVSIGTFKNKSTGDAKYFESLIDRITNSIVNTRKFRVVDNARLKEVLKEQEKSDMGLSDPEKAPAKGKIKSAGFTIYGTVMTIGVSRKEIQHDGISGSQLTAMIELNLRFSDVESAEVIASKTVKVTRLKSELESAGSKIMSNLGDVLIQETVEEAAKQVTDKLMELAYPLMIIKLGQRDVTINVTEERAKTGMLFEVFMRGEEMKDPESGESFGSDEEIVGEVKITRVFPKFAKAEPVGTLKTETLKEGMILRPISADSIKKREDEEREKSKSEFKRRF